MGHETADDQVETAVVLQQVVQLGAGEGIGQAFLHDLFPGFRLQFREELAARTLRIEQAALDTQVAHMHDGRTAGAGRLHQHADFRGGSVQAWQAQGAAAVLFLGIDDQQGALPKGGWRVAASADLQKGERMRHVTTPEKAHAFHSGPYRRACEPLPHAH